MSSYVSFESLIHIPGMGKEKTRVYYKNGVKYTKTVKYVDYGEMQIYNMMKCDTCVNSQMSYTDDGNMDQQCMKCMRYMLKDGELVYTLEDLKWNKK